MSVPQPTSFSVRQALRWVLLGVLPVLAAVAGAYVYLQGLHHIITPEGLSQLDAQVARQAAMLAFAQDFQAMMWLTLAAIPLLALLHTPSPAKKHRSLLSPAGQRKLSWV